MIGEKLKKVYVMRDMKECLCDGREIKNVYVMRERLKNVYVMRDMKECLCDEGYERMFM